MSELERISDDDLISRISQLRCQYHSAPPPPDRDKSKHRCERKLNDNHMKYFPTLFPHQYWQKSNECIKKVYLLQLADSVGRTVDMAENMRTALQSMTLCSRMAGGSVPQEAYPAASAWSDVISSPHCHPLWAEFKRRSANDEKRRGTLAKYMLQTTSSGSLDAASLRDPSNLQLPSFQPDEQRLDPDAIESADAVMDFLAFPDRPPAATSSSARQTDLGISQWPFGPESGDYNTPDQETRPDKAPPHAAAWAHPSPETQAEFEAWLLKNAGSRSPFGGFARLSFPETAGPASLLPEMVGDFWSGSTAESSDLQSQTSAVTSAIGSPLRRNEIVMPNATNLITGYEKLSVGNEDASRATGPGLNSAPAIAESDGSLTDTTNTHQSLTVAATEAADPEPGGAVCTISDHDAHTSNENTGGECAAAGPSRKRTRPDAYDEILDRITKQARQESMDDMVVRQVLNGLASQLQQMATDVVSTCPNNLQSVLDDARHDLRTLLMSDAVEPFLESITPFVAKPVVYPLHRLIPVEDPLGKDKQVWDDLLEIVRVSDPSSSMIVKAIRRFAQATYRPLALAHPGADLESWQLKPENGQADPISLWRTTTLNAEHLDIGQVEELYHRRILGQAGKQEWLRILQQAIYQLDKPLQRETDEERQRRHFEEEADNHGPDPSYPEPLGDWVIEHVRRQVLNFHMLVVSEATAAHQSRQEITAQLEKLKRSLDSTLHWSLTGKAALLLLKETASALARVIRKARVLRAHCGEMKLSDLQPTTPILVGREVAPFSALATAVQTCHSSITGMMKTNDVLLGWEQKRVNLPSLASWNDLGGKDDPWDDGRVDVTVEALLQVIRNPKPKTLFDGGRPAVSYGEGQTVVLPPLPPVRIENEETVADTTTIVPPNSKTEPEPTTNPRIEPVIAFRSVWKTRRADGSTPSPKFRL